MTKDLAYALAGILLRALEELVLGDAATDRGRAVTGGIGAERSVQRAAFDPEFPDLGGGPAGAGQRLAGVAEEGV